MAKDVSLEDIKATVKNTRVIRETFSSFQLYNFTQLLFFVIGKAPFRQDMCIVRKGATIVSPRLLISPHQQYNLEELIAEDLPEIEARVLFFKNYKMEFNENPIERFKEDLDSVISRFANRLQENKNCACLYTPNTRLWRISLLHYLMTKLFPADSSSRLNDLFNDFGLGQSLN